MTLDAQVEAALSQRGSKRRGDEVDFLCVAHDETVPSAGWNRKKGAWNCLKCGNGGSTRDLAERLGIEVVSERKQAEESQVVATYDYRDEEGRLLFQKIRYQPKRFQIKWAGESRRWVLYRLPELLASEGVVYVVEGEKDADRLREMGLTATTAAEGAQGRPKVTDPKPRQKWKAEYNGFFTGRDVVLLPDNDDAGKLFAEWVAGEIRPVARRVRVLALPGLDKKEDVSDWLFRGGTAEELQQLVDEAEDWEPAEEPAGIAAFNTTDAGNAELFAHLYGDRVRFDWTRNRFLIWDNHRWQADPDGEMYRMALAAARARQKAAADVPDRKLADALWSFGKASESTAKIDAMLKSLRAMPSIKDAGLGWDANPMLIGTENGVVNLAEGVHRPGKFDDRITLSCGIAYEPKACAPRWMQFLDEVFMGDEEVISFIQRAVGYSLTGSVKEQVWFLCYGNGANGKSTFVDVLTRLLGEYAGDTPADTLCGRGGLSGGGAPSPDIAALQGKRFVTCSETEELAKVNAGRVKWLTGGNPVTGRFLHSNLVTFTPAMKLWLTTNHLPRVDDDSDGYWRRVRLVPFKAKFEGADRDPDIEDKLMKELPGIFAWAVRGATEWQKQGLNPPASVMLATNSYRQASDPLGEFISDCCVVRDGVRSTRGQLYEAYKAWARAQGMSEKELLGSASFGRRVGERWDNRKASGVRWYLGIAPRSDDSPPEGEENRDVMGPEGTLAGRDEPLFQIQRDVRDVISGKRNPGEPEPPPIGLKPENNVPNVPLAIIPSSSDSDMTPSGRDVTQNVTSLEGRYYVPCPSEADPGVLVGCDGRAFWIDKATDELRCRQCHPRPTGEGI